MPVDIGIDTLDERRIVLGRLRISVLEAAADTDLIGEIMSLAPTTIRPDELVDSVTRRMADRGVDALLVTRPTAELIDQFIPSGEASDE